MIPKESKAKLTLPRSARVMRCLLRIIGRLKHELHCEQIEDASYYYSVDGCVDIFDEIDTLSLTPFEAAALGAEIGAVFPFTVSAPAYEGRYWWAQKAGDRVVETLKTFPAQAVVGKDKAERMIALWESEGVKAIEEYCERHQPDEVAYLKLVEGLARRISLEPGKYPFRLEKGSKPGIWVLTGAKSGDVSFETDAYTIEDAFKEIQKRYHF